MKINNWHKIIVCFLGISIAFSKYCFAQSWEQIEDAIRDEFRFAQPGVSEYESTPFMRTLNNAREEYAREQTEGIAKSMAASQAATNAYNTQVIQTALHADQLRNFQLARMAALETQYQNSTVNLRNSYYQSTLQTIGLSIIGVLVGTALNHFINEWENERAWQREVEERRISYERFKLEKRQEEIRKQMNDLLQNLIFLKQLADQIPYHGNSWRNWFSSLFQQGPDYSRLIDQYNLLAMMDENIIALNLPLPKATDSFAAKAVFWDRVFDIYNEEANIRNQEHPLLITLYDKRNLMSHQELAVATLLNAKSLASLPDQVIIDALDADLRGIDKRLVKEAQEVCQNRSLNCKWHWIAPWDLYFQGIFKGPSESSIRIPSTLILKNGNYVRGVIMSDDPTGVLIKTPDLGEIFFGQTEIAVIRR